MHSIWQAALDLSNALCQYFHMTHLKIARAYLRALRSWSEQDQAEVVEAYAKANGWHLTIIRESVEGREAWLRMLRTGGRKHVALLPGLHILAEPESAGKGRPTVDFAATMTELAQIAPLIVDAVSGVTSAMPREFAAIVRDAGNTVARGRRPPLDREKARKMAAKRWAPGMPRGLMAVWQEPWNAPIRDECKDVWMSRRYANDAEAWEAVNKCLERKKKPELIIGSATTARRIFGSRGKR